MATRQYIGARYVIKIYENSVTPGSAEWEGGTSYEPLTMVTYQNSSYISKKQVPSTAGNPNAEPNYWALTGYYNGQISALQTAVNELNDKIGTMSLLPTTDQSSIVNAIVELSSDLNNSVGGLSQSIANEAQNRADADTQLQNAINSEISNRQSADTAFNSALLTERSERNAADLSLRQAIDALVSPSGQSVVVDSSLSVSGAAADANVTGNSVDSILTALKGCKIPVVSHVFIQSTINGQTGQLSPSNTRLTSNAFSTENIAFITLTALSGFKYSRHCYDANMGYLNSLSATWMTGTNTIDIPENAAYMRFVFAKSDDSVIVVDEAASLSVDNIINKSINPLSIITKGYTNLALPVMRNGAASAPANAYAVAITDIIPIKNCKSITIYIPRPLASGHKYQVRYNAYNIETGITGIWDTNIHRVVMDQIVDFEGDNVTINIKDSTWVGIAYQVNEFDSNNDMVALRTNTNFNYIGDTFAIKDIVKNTTEALEDVTGLKRIVNDVKYLSGALSNLQAFTIYNNKIYSVAEGAISEQDLSFNVINSAAVSIGHANSLQLGESHYAYSSGWNDNKIYKIDLDTLNVVETYTLPTTGYTTGVIDENNHKCYILQRDTIPGDSDAYYKFICYNLTTGSIEFEKYVDKFRALQSMDFVYGRIFVVSGLATNDSKNELRIFNTNGDLLSKSYIGDIIPLEVEGVYYDRTNGGLYISDAGKGVAKIK